jgi:Hypothetical protein (DUF2513)
VKRDMDLVRTILLAIEARPFTGTPSVLSIPGEDQGAVNYHLLLLKEAGYIDVVTMKGLGPGGPQVWPSRLTWEGHEFIDAARNETVWKEAWGQVKAKGGGIAVEVLKALLVQISKHYFLGSAN